MGVRSRTITVALWILVVLYSAFIFWLSSSSDPMPDAGPIPYNDKAYHIFLYMFYGFLIYLAMHFTWEKVPRSHLIAFALGAVVLFAITDEMHQMFVSSRDPSIGDILADALGGFIGIVIAWLWRARNDR